MRSNSPTRSWHASGGFSLVELILTVAIFGILLSLALPSLTIYTANARLRADAQNFVAGLQKARTEAVQRNARVDFVLTNAALAALDPTTGVANGANWVIQTNNPRTFIEGKLGSEAGAPSDIRINDTNGDGAADAGAVASITFNGMGTTDLAGGTTVRFTSAFAKCANPANRSTADFPGSVQSSDTPPTSDLRCLNIIVSRGGSIRLCDPAVVPSADDSRSCS